MNEEILIGLAPQNANNWHDKPRPRSPYPHSRLSAAGYECRFECYLEAGRSYQLLFSIILPGLK